MTNSMVIEVDGTQARYIDGSFLGETVIDYVAHVNTVKQALVFFKSRLIVIEGAEHSGKSGLARVLNHNFEFSQLIDCTEFMSDRPVADITHLIREKKTLYIIDEVDLVSRTGLEKLVQHIIAGGQAIMFLQNRNSLSQDKNMGLCTTWFELSREDKLQLLP